MKMHTMPGLLLAMLITLNSATLAATGTTTPPKGIYALPGNSAADFSLENIDGEPFSLADAQGRWLFLHFWASWCVPCRKEMPAIERLQAALGDQGPRIVLINTAEDEDTVFEFLAAVATDLDSLLDTDGTVTEQWKPRGLPATWLVDPEGRVRYQALGGLHWDAPLYVEFLRQLPR